MDNPSAALRSRILLHMNAWGKAANVVFSGAEGIGQVRIAPGPSGGVGRLLVAIGTEILEIPEDEPTLNLEGFTMRTSEGEYRRVVRHEAGTRWVWHEHMRSDIVKRIDRAKAIKYFDCTESWSAEDVEEQVLTPLSKKSLMARRRATVYHVLSAPGSIMKDGKAVPGGLDINPQDAAFATSLYPKPEQAQAEAGNRRASHLRSASTRRRC